MPTRYFLSALCSCIYLFATSQKIKVKRKGVEPADVTKTTNNTSKYSLTQLNGKWQESSRTDEASSPVSFKDTLFYYFSGDNKVFSRDGVNMSLMGEAEIDETNTLTAAADVFTIKSLTNNQVVLDDGEHIHTLIKKDKFWYESLPSNAIIPATYTTPVEVNASALIGNWKVYRRDAAPGSKSGAVLIRMLNIKQNKDDRNASGEITFYQTDKFETIPCRIYLDDKKIKITSENNSWNMNVYKADGTELVFGDASLMYYCKQL